MSYQSISVKEAVHKINAQLNGWFLPAVQRPYVWGSRYENELYICKLFDSILRGYPIGGLIIWNTEEVIPFREFICDFHEFGDPAKITEKGHWAKKDKGLVYDGQQRLQTLFSCLRYTFNNKILIFDLTFNHKTSNEPDVLGFSFVVNNIELPWNIIRMNELFTKLPDEQKKFEREILRRVEKPISEDQEELVCTNLSDLWKVFVETDKKSLTYFPISTPSEDEVNEIFERLNTGGIPLSLSDLLFSKIKDEFPLFEENLQTKAKEIYNKTDKGYTFNAYNILQVLFLIVKSQVRVDPKKINKKDIQEFNNTWTDLEKPLIDFFNDYIWGQFKINNSSIIPKKILLLPMIVYFYEIYLKGYTFKDISKDNLVLLNKFLVKSQINDWSLQSYIDNFSSIIREVSKNAKKSFFNFPLSSIEEFINKGKKRSFSLFEETFILYRWFTLKILMPDTFYQFEPDSQGRFNPEIDHIFPKKLKNQTKEYERTVDIIWNLQPTKGEINGYKTNHHPKLFFTDKATNTNGDIIKGSKYIQDYKFLFPVKEDKTIDFNNPIWEKPIEFINNRRIAMVNFLKNNYDLTFTVPETVLTNSQESIQN